jgi:hypothetical protein
MYFTDMARSGKYRNAIRVICKNEGASMATPRVNTDYPVELIAPDISPYRRGNVGVEFATTYDSGSPGPHVLISAIVHGNELCGAIALDWLYRQNPRPVVGKLTLVFANAVDLSWGEKAVRPTTAVDQLVAVLLAIMLMLAQHYSDWTLL